MYECPKLLIHLILSTLYAYLGQNMVLHRWSSSLKKCIIEPFQPFQFSSSLTPLIKGSRAIQKLEELGFIRNGSFAWAWVNCEQSHYSRLYFAALLENGMWYSLPRFLSWSSSFTSHDVDLFLQNVLNIKLGGGRSSRGVPQTIPPSVVAVEAKIIFNKLSIMFKPTFVNCFYFY